MRKCFSGFTTLLMLAVLMPGVAAQAMNISLSAEPAVVWTGYNKFQVPGTSAASLVNLPAGDAAFAYRIYSSFGLTDTWSLRLLYAPLTATYRFTPSSDVVFNGKTFVGGSALSVGYKFNSYRASLIHTWGAENATQWKLGFTLKVRDAYIDLNNSSANSRYSNVGLVPLVYLGVSTPITNRFSFAADLDGLAGGPGRAFDGRAQIAASVSESQAVSLGYRFVEGGADMAKTYNFALFHFAYLGYLVTL